MVGDSPLLMSEEFGERQKIVRQILVFGKMFKQVQGVPRVLIGLCPSGLFLMTFAMGGMLPAGGEGSGQSPRCLEDKLLRISGSRAVSGAGTLHVGDSPSRFSLSLS